MIQLPNRAHAWRTAIRRGHFTFNLVTRAEAGFMHPLYFMGCCMDTQGFGKLFPLFNAKTKPGEKACLTGTKTMCRV